MMLTPDFRKSEFQCACCGTCDMRLDFMEALQELRSEYGKPMIITSGYRCDKHNKKVGGAPQSLHLAGNAVDILCTSMLDRYALVGLAFKYGFTGIEISPKHVHLDMRPTTPRLMWTDFKRVA